MLLTRQKIMLTTVAVCALIILLSTFAYILAAMRVSRDNLAPQLNDTYAGLAQTQLSAANVNLTPDTLQSLLNQMTRHYLVSEAAIYNADGERLAHSYQYAPQLKARLNENPDLDDIHSYVLHSGRGELQLVIRNDLSPARFFILDTLTTSLFVVFVSALLIFILYASTRHFQRRPYRQLLRSVQLATGSATQGKAHMISSDDPDYQPLIRALNDLLWQYQQRTQKIINAHEQAESARQRAIRLSSETRQINEHLAQEIAVRQGIETQLTITQFLLDDIINAMPSALFVLDENLYIIQCNELAGDWLSQPHQQLAGKNLLNLIPELQDFYDQLKNTEAGIRKKERFNIKSFHSGTSFDLILYPLTGQQQARQVLRIDDETRRQQLEEKMVESEKMATVAGLAAGIAHEINNPLGAILQNLQNIRRRLQPGLKANEEIAEENNLLLDGLSHYLQQREINLFMDNIQQAGERAAEIVANMLKFSRTEPQQKLRCDLNSLIADSLTIAAGDQNLRHIYIDFSPSEQPVFADLMASEMEQVILNLVVNGAQALLEYQHDQQRTRPQWQARIKIRALCDEGQPVITIEDNGPGIDAKDIPHIFEPFYTTKDVGKGTGLGLFVSWLIVTSHHMGKLQYFKSCFNGAGFEIRLPPSALRE